MTAAERIYLERFGELAEPPRWADQIEHQEALGLAQSAALVAERNSRADRPARAARWALHSILWGHRAAWLLEHPPATPRGSTTFGRHARLDRARRSQSSAIARYRRDHPRSPQCPK
jgi:hypothetical protein